MNKAEEFIQNYTRNCSNEIIGGGWNNGEFVHIFKPWLTPDEARRAVEIAKEEIIEKVCMYLNEHRNGVIDDEYIINLNKAMKNE